jgi:hypothetical protein
MLGIAITQPPPTGGGGVIEAQILQGDTSAEVPLTCHSEEAKRPKNLLTTNKYGIFRCAQDDKMVFEVSRYLWGTILAPGGDYPPSSYSRWRQAFRDVTRS